MCARSLPTKKWSRPMPFHERIFGEVTGNADPKQQRRLKIRCPALVREDAELPFWIKPMSLGRVFDVPALGDRIELLIIAGRSDSQDIARLDENSVRWSPAFQDEDVIPKEVLDNYADALALWTPDGSFAMLDKKTGAVAIVKPDGSRMDINADGIITVMHKDGSSVTLDDSVIELAHSGGDKLTLDGTNIKLDGASLLGGSATYFIVRGDKLLTFLTNDKIWKDTHSHPTAALGPPSVPTVPSPTIPTDLNSTTQKTE